MLLHQELAADALAAGAAGGRAAYVVALSRLALRQTGRPPGWPARAFLSTRGTLMRRIAMLRAKDRPAEGSLSWAARVALITLLALVALGVSALRSPAQKPPDEPQAQEGRRLRGQGAQELSLVSFVDSGTVNHAVPRFNLSYLPPEAMGAFGIRPAAVFARPALKKHAERFNRLLEENYALLGLKAKLGLRLEDIEQVTGAIRIVTTPRRPDAAKDAPQSALLTDPFMIRTVHDFDWKAKLLAALPDLKEARHAGKVYYQHPGRLVPMLGPDLCFFVADSRTLVLGGTKSFRNMLEGQRGDSSAWGEDWKRVERELFALALDNRSRKWLEERRQPEEAMDAAEVALFENADSFVVGVDDVSGALFQGFARCASEDAAGKVAGAINDLLGQARRAVKKAAKDQPSQTAAAVQGQKFVQELLRQVKVRREETAVTVRSRTNRSLDDVLEPCFAGIPPVVSVKVEPARKPAAASGP
jgi:hypothetical protein